MPLRGSDQLLAPVSSSLIRWLLAHGTRADDAWRPDLWGERILFWTAYAPYILSSRDAGYRSALLNPLARGARHIEAIADSYWHLRTQHRSAWTHEIDLRPYKEPF